jgi:cytosine/adenosine deaminase-related metal-dependent hydrolase
MEDCEFVGPDVWFAHGIFFNDQELEKLAATGTAVGHCPSSNMRLGSGICRVRELLDHGGIVGIGVDGSASNDSSDMLGEMRQTMLLQRVRYGAQGITAREVYRMASEGGARILGYDKIGKLEEGMLADIALFDVQKLEYTGGLSDPAAALIFCGYNHEADWTIVNGKVVVEHGELTGHQEEEIRIHAGAVAQRLLEKAGVA